MIRLGQLTLTMVAMIFTAFLGVASAHDTAPASTPLSEANARETALQWAAYVGQGDVPALERLLNEKYLHIHGTALVETRAQFLDALRNGTRKYDPINMEEITVRLFGSTAVVSGKFNLKAVVRGKKTPAEIAAIDAGEADARRRQQDGEADVDVTHHGDGIPPVFTDGRT